MFVFFKLSFNLVMLILSPLYRINSHISTAQHYFFDCPQTMISIALYQPDIPQNVGATMRLCACLGMDLHVIEPCGFPWDERKIKQAGMDYIDHVRYERHASWQVFLNAMHGRRIILMTTKASVPYPAFTFEAGDILLAGRESSGVPDDVHAGAQGRVAIPMRAGLRSLNVVNATAMIAGEALRQTYGF
jgi:tRNA (cytidine/uridine-2'-O-)-methyltransferase